MSCTEDNSMRWRRIAAAALALPLALGMTGTALAATGTGRPDTAVDTAAEAKPADTAADEPAVNALAQTAGAARDSSADADKHGTPTSGPLSQPQSLSKADTNGTGANPGETCTHAYCSTRDGSPSGNGVGDGNANGKPCAGCVGKADNKDPKGQGPDGSDANAGYECDGNQGIGKTNPAHTGCTVATSSPTSSPTPSEKPGEATMKITADCRTVTVTSSKDISHVVVVFKDGTSVKLDGLTGKHWTRTFDKDVASASGTSATTTVTAVATACGVLPTVTPTPTPPATTCPDGSPLPATGKDDCPRPSNDQLTICHATGSSTNPYVVLTTSTAGVANGHYGIDHQGGRDIIPAFTHQGVDYAAQGDQALLGTGCVPPGSTVVETCPDGSVMPGGDPDLCPKAPPVCPAVQPTTGPVMAGCFPPGPSPVVPPTQGGGTPITDRPQAQPATNPVPVGPPAALPPAALPPAALPPAAGPPAAVPPSAVLPHTAVGPAILTGTPARPAQARAVPSTLPFTGTEAALLAELGLLLLVAGGGVLVVARRERTARAA